MKNLTIKLHSIRYTSTLATIPSYLLYSTTVHKSDLSLPLPPSIYTPPQPPTTPKKRKQSKTPPQNTPIGIVTPPINHGGNSNLTHPSPALCFPDLTPSLQAAMYNAEKKKTPATEGLTRGRSSHQSGSQSSPSEWAPRQVSRQ